MNETWGVKSRSRSNGGQGWEEGGARGRALSFLLRYGRGQTGSGSFSCPLISLSPRARPLFIAADPHKALRPHKSTRIPSLTTMLLTAATRSLARGAPALRPAAARPALAGAVASRVPFDAPSLAAAPSRAAHSRSSFDLPDPRSMMSYQSTLDYDNKKWNPQLSKIVGAYHYRIVVYMHPRALDHSLNIICKYSDDRAHLGAASGVAGHRAERDARDAAQLQPRHGGGGGAAYDEPAKEQGAAQSVQRRDG